MALNRIQFSASDTGLDPYTLTLNPSEIDLQDDLHFNTLEILDGGQVLQPLYFDGRPLTMSWKHIPVNYSGFTAMLASLQSYAGTIMYVNFQDVDYRINTTTSWNKVIFGNVKTDVESGGALKYNVTVTLYPEV